MIVMTFEGLLPIQSFADFAQHRAARLSLNLTVLSQNIERACFILKGPHVLIDAFEMAMSLGPAECHVKNITRRNLTADDLPVDKSESFNK